VKATFGVQELNKVSIEVKKRRQFED
jgi:hypothetical protein